MRQNVLPPPRYGRELPIPGPPPRYGRELPIPGPPPRVSLAPRWTLSRAGKFGAGAAITAGTTWGLTALLDALKRANERDSIAAIEARERLFDHVPWVPGKDGPKGSHPSKFKPTTGNFAPKYIPTSKRQKTTSLNTLPTMYGMRLRRRYSARRIQRRVRSRRVARSARMPSASVNRNRLMIGPVQLDTGQAYCWSINNPGQTNRFYNKDNPSQISNVPELGSFIYKVDASGTSIPGGPFTTAANIVGQSGYDMAENLSYNQPDPMGIFLKNVRLRFHFTGDQSDMHVFITVVRQKKIFTPTATWGAQENQDWKPPLYTEMSELSFPKNARCFLGCADPVFQNRIDTNTYEVLATKRFKVDNLYENERIGDTPTELQSIIVSGPTTGRERSFGMTIPINRSFKPLAAPKNQFADVYQTNYIEGGPYKYDNLHPLSNIWCIVSSTSPNYDVSGATPVKFSVQMSHTWLDKSGSVK